IGSTAGAAHRTGEEEQRDERRREEELSHGSIRLGAGQVSVLHRRQTGGVREHIPGSIAVWGEMTL
ncbi:MAG: hypothetical protein AAF665_18755, partial [Pseudomonadota bacterium]